jgi:hypothetical protein
VSSSLPPKACRLKNPQIAPIHVIPAQAGIHFFSPQIAPISADFELGTDN